MTAEQIQRSDIQTDKERAINTEEHKEKYVQMHFSIGCVKVIIALIKLEAVSVCVCVVVGGGGAEELDRSKRYRKYECPGVDSY